MFLLRLHLFFWHCVIPMSFIKGGWESMLPTWLECWVWSVNFSLEKVWGEVTDVTACLLKGRQNGCLSWSNAASESKCSRQTSQTWRDISRLLTKQLICGALFSRYCRTKLATTASLRVFFLSFPHLNEWRWKSWWLLAVIPTAVTAISVWTETPKQGNRITIMTFRLLLPDTCFSFLHIVSYHHRAQKCFMHCVRLGNVSTLVDIG